MTETEVASTASGERFARVGSLRLCYETFGSPDDPPMLLIMGLASQMLLWSESFCEQLAARGFHVVRFDNRDVGRSTILADAPVPSRWQLVARDRHGAAYSLEEMAGDAAGLLEVLEMAPAHVVGVSMGGMIAQQLAISHPASVRSLVSIMSTTGARRVGRPRPRVAARMLRPAARDMAGYVEDHLTTYRTIGSPGYPLDEPMIRARAERIYARGIHPAGAARQMAAIVTAQDRTERLRRVEVPATVIHGDADPLVDVSGGRATAAAIPGARLLELPGMGHDLPEALWPEIIDAIAETASAPS